jgi:peptidase YpeB-like protein
MRRDAAAAESPPGRAHRQGGAPCRRRRLLSPLGVKEKGNMAAAHPADFRRSFPGGMARLPRLASALCCFGLAAGGLAGQADARPRPAVVVHAGFAAPGPPTVLGDATDAGGPSWRLVAEQQQESDDAADLPPGAKVTRDEAASIALKTVAGEVTSVDVERKLGKIVYTVEIQTTAGEETDVFVDVVTGEVLGTE